MIISLSDNLAFFLVSSKQNKHVVSLQQMSSEFPITNKQACIEHQGQKTEVLVTGFQDKIFVVITQYGKIGSLVNQNKTIQ